jgi:hypothetical protein
MLDRLAAFDLLACGDIDDGAATAKSAGLRPLSDALGIRGIRARASHHAAMGDTYASSVEGLALSAHSSGNRQVGRDTRDGAPHRRGKTQSREQPIAGIALPLHRRGIYAYGVSRDIPLPLAQHH